MIDPAKLEAIAKDWETLANHSAIHVVAQAAYQSCAQRLRDLMVEELQPVAKTLQSGSNKVAITYWCPTCKEVVDPQTVDDPEVSKVFSLLPSPRHFVEMGDGTFGMVARYHDVEKWYSKLDDVERREA